MILNFLFGNQNNKAIKKIQPIVGDVVERAKKFRDLERSDIRKEIVRLKALAEKGEKLDNLLVDSFALTKIAAEKTLNQSHYPVQIIGGVVLHQGKIAEMKTGEGKTLTATLPLVLNALSGKGSHLITVNDYLAKWQAAWMGKIYNYLGLEAGVVLNDQYGTEKKSSYGADITYGTNNEVGFDYLRDNLATSQKEKVQRKFNFAIVDEVDSILIDEARTPLIISAPISESPEAYMHFTQVVSNLKENDDFVVDEKDKRATLTEEGLEKVEGIIGRDPYGEDSDDSHYLENALKAKALFKKDVDYILRDGEVNIVDEFTGRVLAGRRYSDGLHQAIEAKENVEVKKESRTIATISFQNLFRLYPKLSGMTGTALTSSEEFDKVYNLQVVSIPTNKPVIRDDRNDKIYATKEAKLKAVAKEVKERNEKGQPILIGTVSVEDSEEISRILKINGVKHDVLNAKNHARESDIVAQAGRIGQVTIATNMAGRGTDILLGGNPEELARRSAEMDSIPSITELETEDSELKQKIDKYLSDLKRAESICKEEKKEVLEAGGLCVIGTERHEARRIDDQLRGRSGRQGDPGLSVFFLSLEDNLLRIFGGGKMQSVLKKTLGDEEALEMKMLSKRISGAQKMVEGRNFDVRKRLIEYDDVVNIQRKTIYEMRDETLESEKIHDQVLKDIEIYAEILVQDFASQGEMDFDKKVKAFVERLAAVGEDFEEKITPKNLPKSTNLVKKVLLAEYKEKAITSGNVWYDAEKRVKLHVIDRLWTDHIDQMSRMREGINLRSYAQRDPLQEYKREGFEMFGKLQDDILKKSVDMLFRASIQKKEKEPVNREEMRTNADTDDRMGLKSETNFQNPNAIKGKSVTSSEKVGRNDPCPCGSGKKFKKCHGKNS